MDLFYFSDMTSRCRHTAQVSLELLLTMTLRNQDRASLLWPLLHDVLAGIMSAETTTAPGEAAGILHSPVVVALYQLAGNMCYTDAGVWGAISLLGCADRLPCGVQGRSCGGRRWECCGWRPSCWRRRMVLRMRCCAR